MSKNVKNSESKTSMYVFDSKLKKADQIAKLGLSLEILENLIQSKDLPKVRTMFVEMMMDYQAKPGNFLDDHERTLLLDVYHILDIN